MARILRILISVARLIMVVFCTLANPLGFLSELALRVMVSAEILLYILLVAFVLIETIKNIEELYFNMLNYGCYYGILFIHVLFCINIPRSTILKDFIDAKIYPQVFWLQLFVQLTQTICPFWVLRFDQAWDFRVTIALGLCAVETIFIVCILLKKINNSIRTTGQNPSLVFA